MVDVAYAQYGMGVRSILVGVSNNQITVIVITQGWPSWAFAAQAVGWQIKKIILMEKEWLGKIKTWFADCEVILYSDWGGTSWFGMHSTYLFE